MIVQVVHENYLLDFSEIPSVSELSKEMDDSNMSENFDESLSHETVKERENTFKHSWQEDAYAYLCLS